MRALFFFLVSSGAHYLAARWVLATFPSLRARARARLVRRVAAGIALLLPVLYILNWASDRDAFHFTTSWALVELSIVVLALVPIGLIMLLTRGAARVVEAVAPAADDAAKARRISRREVIERGASVTFVGATSAVLGWGIVRGRHAFAVEEAVVKVAGWPRALDGYVIAQVSDIHVGLFVGDRELDEGFALVRGVRPDLVVATGDLVDAAPEAIGPLLARLTAERTGARDGAYAVLGNHDHYAGGARVARALASSGAVLLDNRGVHVRPHDGGGFALLGVDDYEGSRRSVNGGPDLDRALATVPRELPRVLLAHQPRFFDEAQRRVALQLSGHTHGGQINPGLSPARALLSFVAGRYERQGSTLWVNRGFGVVGPPARIGAPPEVTKIVLVSG